MNAPSGNSERLHRAGMIAFAVILLLAGWLRYDNQDSQHSFDELWTTTILEFMAEHDTLDSNYNNGLQRLLPGVKYDQYLNNSYFTVAHFWLEATGSLSAKTPKNRQSLRLLNLILDLALMAGLFAFIRARFSTTTALVTLWLYAWLPFAVYDAHIARLESFMNAIGFLVMVTAFQIPKNPRLFLLLSSVFVGIASASKPNLLTLLFFPVFFIFHNSHSRQATISIRDIASWAGIMLAGIFGGAVLTAPHILLNSTEYLWGMQRLFHQYEMSVPPTGHPGGGLIHVLVRNLWGHASATGPIIMLLAAISFFIPKKPHSHARLIQAFLVLSVALMLTQKTYWDRNLSHTHWMVCLCAAMTLTHLIERSQTRFATTLAVGLIAVASIQPAFYALTLKTQTFPGHYKQDTLAYERELMASRPGMKIVRVKMTDTFALRAPPADDHVVYRLDLKNSSWDGLFLQKLATLGFTIIGELKTPFFLMPAGDITMLHSARYVYISSKPGA